MTERAPAEIALVMKLFPSTDIPAIATKTAPGRTRRLSQQTPLASAGVPEMTRARVRSRNQVGSSADVRVVTTGL